MEVPGDLSEEFGVAIQLRRLWRRYPTAHLSVEPVSGDAYKASVAVPGGPTAVCHSSDGLHALKQYLADGGEAKRCDLLPKLHTIACPVLLMGGEDDPVTTIEDMAETAAAIRSHLVRFERIANCGLGPFFDAPQRTIEAIREFILSGE